MHGYTLTRGNLDAIKRWENDMAACYMPFQYKENKTGKIINTYVQLAPRRVFIHEFVFPEECERDWMGLIKPSNYYGKWFDRGIMLLRKVLKLRAPMKKWTPKLFPLKEGIATVVIGMKKDKMKWTKRKGSIFDHDCTPKEML